MSSPTSIPDAAIPEAIEHLLSSVKSVQLATLNKHQEPEISYTPFIRVEHCYYIFISELAAHTQNLKQHAKLSLLFIQDEQDCKNIFARKRLILECQSSLIKRDIQEWDALMLKFEEIQGNTISVLKSLADFHLFRITPEKGSYVQGFGKAFELTGKNLSQVAAKVIS